MATSDPLINKKLGDYTIQKLLGKGGMARVYQGYDENLDRYAAIKVISGDFATADEAEYNERFLKEARAIARLSNSNIVGVYQFGQDEGVYYMAMHFLDGEDLRTILRRYAKEGKRMPPVDILRMARDMANALDYAHSEGVVHRDIKPSNIMINKDGKAVLTDFGLALSIPEGTMGDTFGTAHYIAPEQAISSANAVPQSDLYSLGVVLYEAFAGQVPFDEPSAMSVALKHLNEPPPPPSLYNPAISKPVERVLLRALSKDPKERYQTGRELVDALEKGVTDTSEDTAAYNMLAEMKTTPMKPDEPMTPADSSGSLQSYLRAVEEAGSRPSAPERPSSNMGGYPPPGSGIRVPSEFTPPPYASQPYPPSMIYPPPERHNTMLIVVVTLLAVAVVGVLAYLLLFANQKDEDLTDVLAGVRRTELAEERETSEAAQAASQTAIALFTDTSTPTDTPTDTPTSTPTDTPTDTSTPTNTPTDTPTNTPTDTPTDTPTNTPTDTPTSTSTDTPTDTPTNTPTDTPTNTPTDTPTNTPTDTPSSTPTEEPTEAVVVPTPLPPEVQLIYSSETLIIINVAEEPINISRLRFERVGENSTYEIELNRAFGQTGNQLASLPPGDCYQLVTTASVANDTFLLQDICNVRYGWAVPGVSSIFWVNNEEDTDNTPFSVFTTRNRELAECAVVEGRGFMTCEFSTAFQTINLPQSNIETTPTDTPESLPTDTPNPATNTAEPTRTPTDTAEPTDTKIPTVTATTVAADISLIYDSDSVFLLNSSEENQDIGDLNFVQISKDGGKIQFAASSWANNNTTGIGSIYALPPDACYQLVANNAASGTVISECEVRYGWIFRNASSHFWLSADSSVKTFTVYQGDKALMECEIDAGRCDFAMP